MIVVLDKLFFTEMGSLRPVVIIIGMDTITKHKNLYVGTGYGDSEESDIKKVLKLGAKVDVNSLTEFLRKLE